MPASFDMSTLEHTGYKGMSTPAEEEEDEEEEQQERIRGAQKRSGRQTGQHK